jgi:site-specific recombinase XerD
LGSRLLRVGASRSLMPARAARPRSSSARSKQRGSDTRVGNVRRTAHAPRHTPNGAGLALRTDSKGHLRGHGRASQAPDAILKRFEIYLRQHALSPATIRNYLADLRAFLRWYVLSHSDGRGYTAVVFRAYREYLCHETVQSTATVNRRLQSLRLFGRHLLETGQLAENPTREIELLPNHNGNGLSPRCLTRPEIARLTKAVQAGRPSLVRRDFALLHLMLHAGLRVHEVAALFVDDVTRTRRGACVRVRGNGGYEERSVPLKRMAFQAVREYLEVRPAIPQMPHLFVSQKGQPLSVRSIQRIIDTYARAAGLKGVCAQSLRHTCARTMLEATEDAARVARWLGHTDVRALERYMGRR